MKRVVLVCASLALAACGNNSHSGEKGVFFVPRSAVGQLDGVKVVGTHDSGLLVEASADQEKAIKAKAPQSFRYDQWKPEFSRYDLDSMDQKVHALAQKYPNLLTLDTYGTSREGRPEYVLTMGNKSDSTPKTQLMITAATHGNEIATVDVVLGLMEKLLAGYGTDDRLTAMVNNHTIYWLPAVCVDSYVAQTRANDGVDPNRSYPYPDDENAQPTQAIGDTMAFFNAHDIAGSMDYHDAASMIMFPWAYTYNKIPDADYQKLDDLTTRMAATNGFAHGDIADTIYVAPGSSADYYYWKHHTMATAIELSHDYAASYDGAVDDLLNESTEQTWVFIENFK